MGKDERARRNRLLAPADARMQAEPYLSAPYMHRNSERKYHAVILRAVEKAKRGAGGPKHILSHMCCCTRTNKASSKRSRVMERGPFREPIVFVLGIGKGSP